MVAAARTNAATCREVLCRVDLPYPVARTAAQGAEIALRMAILDSDGPTGGFSDDAGSVRW
jgi:hypothetical protein